MSKILEKYNELKNEDKDKLYLFKSGKFYIFICDDCEKIRDFVVLKKVKFTNDTFKCGFPSNVLNEYLKVFKNLNLNVEVVESFELNNSDERIIEKYSRILKYVNDIDINNIKPIEAINKLDTIRRMINE